MLWVGTVCGCTEYVGMKWVGKVGGRSGRVNYAGAVGECVKWEGKVCG